MEMHQLEIMVFPDGRLTAKDAGRYLGCSPKTLASMRSKGNGPRFIRRGRIFYFKQDLDDWINETGRHKSASAARLARVEAS